MTRAGHFFDLGGTLLALDGDEVAWGAAGRVTFLPGVRDRLRALAGTPVFVVTNQATVSAERLAGIRAQVTAGLGGVLTAFAACTHPVAAGCACRKPRPGLVLHLAAAHGIDLPGSLLVGDTEADRRLALAAGVGRFQWAGDYFGPL